MGLMPPETIYATLLDELIQQKATQKDCIDRIKMVVAGADRTVGQLIQSGGSFPVDTDPSWFRTDMQAILDYMQIEPVIRQSNLLASYFKAAAYKRRPL